MQDKVLKRLDKMIKPLYTNIIASDNIGLYNGQVGITLLLYYYYYYKKDKAIRGMADKLLESVLEKITTYSEREVVGIALSICYLINNKFIESDTCLFEDIDDWLFENKENKKYPPNIHEVIMTGTYIDRRMEYETQGKKAVWKERLREYFRSIFMLLCNKHRSVLPIINCSELLFLIQLCTKYENDSYFKHEIELLYEDLDIIIKIALHEDSNNADKYLLLSLLGDSKLKMSYEPADVWSAATLMDINHFYFHRFIIGSKSPTPTVIEKEMLLMVRDQKKITMLLSLLSPNTSGLDGYIGGFSWALLQWCIENYKIN